MNKTVILIAGTWENELVFAQLLAKNHKYLFAGKILMDFRSKQSYKAGFDWEYDREILGVNSENLPKKPSHMKSVFMIEGKANSLEDLNSFCEVISEIIKIGGADVKIFNCEREIVFSADEWGELSFNKNVIFDIFVSNSYSKQGTWTWGMNNFSQKDIFTPLEFDEDAKNLVLSFAWWIINENPKIESGETFSLDSSSPVFVILDMPNDETINKETFSHNPLGFWKLYPQEWLLNQTGNNQE